LRCRSFTFGFVSMGIVVEVRTPEELEPMTTLALARRARRGPES
jgi:hypothetical protein